MRSSASAGIGVSRALTDGKCNYRLNIQEGGTFSFSLTFQDIIDVSRAMNQPLEHMAIVDFTTYGPKISLASLAGKHLTSITQTVVRPFVGYFQNIYGNDTRWYIKSTSLGTSNGKPGFGFPWTTANTDTTACNPANPALAADSTFWLNVALLGV